MHFNAHTENGKLAIEAPQKWSKYLSSLKDGTPLSVDVEKRKNRRSLSQNAYYWLYLGVIEDDTGNTAQDLHEYFRRTFLKPITKTIMAKEIRLPASTTELTKHEFSEYLEKICAETGVPLPDPELAGFTSTNKGYAGAPEVKYPEEIYKDPTI